jgi:hypothetical protein
MTELPSELPAEEVLAKGMAGVVEFLYQPQNKFPKTIGYDKIVL